MILDILILAGSLVLILLACVIFVNAVERFGLSFKLHQGIVGSVLAAVGTALPETIVPVVAIFFTRGRGASDIGVGAIAGAPFMLGTLAFFVTGAAVIINHLLGRRPIVMNAEPQCIARDLKFFVVFYGIAVSTTFLHHQIALKSAIAIGLVASYAVYLRQTFIGDCPDVENVADLYLSRVCRLKSTRLWIFVQLGLSLALLVSGAHIFVGAVQKLSDAIGMAPLILSLIITPIATELPEKLNSVIWISRRKDTLAMGNITGAMVFQSCFPVVIGMLFTDWDLRGIIMISALLTLLSALLILLSIQLKKRLNPYALLIGGLLYLVFLFNIPH